MNPTPTSTVVTAAAAAHLDQLKEHGLTMAIETVEPLRSERIEPTAQDRAAGVVRFRLTETIRFRLVSADA